MDSKEIYEAAQEMADAVALLPASDGRILGLLPVLCRLRAALSTYDHEAIRREWPLNNITPKDAAKEWLIGWDARRLAGIKIGDYEGMVTAFASAILGAELAQESAHA